MSRIELEPNLVCTKCSTTVKKGDPMGPTKLVKCPICVGEEMGLGGELDVNEEVVFLGGKYYIKVDISLTGFPTYHYSLDEDRLAKFLAAMEKHRETGAPTEDKGEGDEE
ncbi:MAG TPA: hypothetical protein VMW91_12065 [Desulfosporosinus sp.]|nr:hypothetical protein [Desulfosporosinus sp.]